MATGAVACSILPVDSPNIIPPVDAVANDAVSHDNMSVSVVFRRKEATLTFHPSTQRLSLHRRDFRGREVTVMDVPIESIVNVETKEEQLLRKARCVGLADEHPDDFAKEADAARVHSLWPASGSGVSHACALGKTDSPHSRSTSAPGPFPLSSTSCAAGKKEPTVFLLHYCQGSCHSPGVSLRTVEFTSPSGAEEHMRVCKAVRSLLTAVYSGGVRKLVFFVSPKSGSGKALQICKRKIFPVLQFARHEIEVIVTTRAHHCEDHIADPANGVDGRCVIVLVGGDGIVHEAVNGIHRRRINVLYARQQEEQVAMNDVNAQGLHMGQPVQSGTVSPFFSAASSWASAPPRSGHSVHSAPLIATIAAGSGCGLAKSLDVLSFRKAALALVHLHTCVKDLMSLQYDMGSLVQKPNNAHLDAFPHCKLPPSHCTNSQTAERVAFLSVSVGILTDIDRGSENLRWMGGARFTAYAMYKLVRGFHSYRVKLRYLPWKGIGGRQLQKYRRGDAMPSEMEFPPCTNDGTCAHCQAHSAAEESAQDNAGFVPQWQSIDFDNPSLPWVTLDGDFYSIFIGNLRDAARDVVCAPLAHFSDGAIDLVYTKRDGKGQGRVDFFKFLARLEKGTHVNLPFVSYVKAAAVELTVIDDLVMSDGEVMPFKSVRVTSMRRAAQFVRGCFE